MYVEQFTKACIVKQLTNYKVSINAPSLSILLQGVVLQKTSHVNCRLCNIFKPDSKQVLTSTVDSQNPGVMQLRTRKQACTNPTTAINDGGLECPFLLTLLALKKRKSHSKCIGRVGRLLFHYDIYKLNSVIIFCYHICNL